jgi:hypothetical protein
MAQKTVNELKTNNSDFNNIFDSFVNFAEGGNQGTSGDEIKLAGSLHVVEGSIQNKLNVIQSEGLQLSTSSSGAVILMSGSAAAEYTLPAVTDGNGVCYEFLVASAHAHVLSGSEATGAGKIQGHSIDRGNGTTVAMEGFSDEHKVKLNNGALGDRIVCKGDGVNWYLTAVLNNAPTSAT